ncbi:hypothetical protein HMPREF1526_00773 [Butyricicoccus pullicaecorum 1.2]|uniref:Uncharacterized protein n=1 Tax=Butyricicoccus pullicaecorum 1.2 TaxID=1203606 RepID=R8W581_9FIRM|nr:hypothetical protein HMPREF1526_00773 [Butyricicoccus pullicaecorum 1.2]
MNQQLRKQIRQWKDVSKDPISFAMYMQCMNITRG